MAKEKGPTDEYPSELKTRIGIMVPYMEEATAEDEGRYDEWKADWDQGMAEKVGAIREKKF